MANKKDTINELISNRTYNLEQIYDKYNKNTLMHNCVKKLINKINLYNPCNFENINEKEFIKIIEDYKKLCDEIIILIYNKQNT